MTTPEPKHQELAGAYLRQACAAITPLKQAEYISEISEFEVYLDYGELDRAWHALWAIAEESKSGAPVYEPLALAAAALGLREQQRDLDAHISKLKGKPHETVLPADF